MTTPPTFAVSTESQRLRERLAQVAEGEGIAYAALTRAAGIDVQKSARGRAALNSARRALIRDAQALFVTVRNKGLRRAADGEVARDPYQRTLPAVTREVRRGAKRTTCVKDYAALEAGDKIALNGGRTLLAQINGVTSKKHRKRIEAAVTAQPPPSLAEVQRRTLKALSMSLDEAK